MRHTGRSSSFVLKKPLGHWHDSVAPSENLPALHGLHPDCSATPFTDEYLPEGQLRHVELSPAPTLLLQVPSCITHSVFLICKSASLAICTITPSTADLATITFVACTTAEFTSPLLLHHTRMVLPFSPLSMSHRHTLCMMFDQVMRRRYLLDKRHIDME